MNKVNDKDISMAMPILKRLAWCNKETREKIQKMGINVLPCDFYSSTPSIKEITESFEYAADTPPFLNTQIFEEHRFLKTLEKIAKFSNEFNPPVDEDKKNRLRFFWNNSQFSYSDAMSYYCFIRHIQPSTIIEIGAGFSTLVALEAIEKNGIGSVTCIEPFPRKFLINNKAIDLHCIKAQEVQAGFLNDILHDGDILFVDSTHTVKSGSDCVHIYLRLLPEIRRNIHVHVHDIFLPFGLPMDWLLNRQIFWTEQYLLLALLIDNPKASLVYGSNFNAKQHPFMMEKFMGGKYPFGGGSAWFQYNGNATSHVS